MRVWRIAGARLAGALAKAGSRWTPRGVAVVFTSATLSLAALERFVHTDADLEPLDLVAIPIEIDDDVPMDVIVPEDLPADWRSFPAPPALAEVGGLWFRASRTAVLSVPSVVIPHERNFVLNPAHRDFARVAPGAAEPFSFDPRMWRT